MSMRKVEFHSAAVMQQRRHNESGPHVLIQEFHPNAGDHWCILGLIVDDAFEPDAHEEQLRTSLEAVPGIAKIAEAMLFGQTDASIVANPVDGPAVRQFELRAAAKTTMQLSTRRGARNHTELDDTAVVVPPDCAWVIVNAKLTTPLDTAAKRLAMETAILAISGVHVVEELVSGTIRSDAVGAITLEVTGRVYLAVV